MRGSKLILVWPLSLPAPTIYSIYYGTRNIDVAWKPKLSAIPVLFKEVIGDQTVVEGNEETLERIARAVQ
jgi:hypothetical protein